MLSDRAAINHVYKPLDGLMSRRVPAPRAPRLAYVLEIGRLLFGNLQIGVNPGEKRPLDSEEAGPSQRARTEDASIENQANDLIRRARTLLKQARDSPPVSLVEISALTTQLYEFIQTLYKHQR